MGWRWSLVAVVVAFVEACVPSAALPPPPVLGHDEKRWCEHFCSDAVV
jgi:hypothetical protein